MAETFTATVRQQVDAGIIDLAGDITRDADAELTRAYGEAKGSILLLRFDDVGYINSTGIAVIVGLLARARADGRRVIASGLSPHYREIFEITRLSDFVAIFDDEQSALASEG